MSIQPINIGTDPNDGTGDTLRAAFGKANENFAELDSLKASTATMTALQADVDARMLAAARGAANGVASLDAGGKVPESQLPAIAITDVFTVAGQATMLALTAQRGDIAIRSDLSKTFALAAQPASTLANWLELRTPTDAVLSVAGKTGAVTLTKSDVDLGNVDNSKDADKTVASAAALTALLAPDKGGVPPGALLLFAGTGLPAGYLKANGAAVSRTTYAALFLAIGTAYGAGNGSTTFQLPDLRGEFPRGWDDGRGVDAARAFGSAQSDALQGHTHYRNAANLVEVGFTERTSGAEAAQVAGSRTYDWIGNLSGQVAAGRTATETRPRNLAVHICIKY